ncbi:hypothetical protein NMY22_g10693 [Coprinellus aureogranulatus]|nr:hypothetical protein NMY22_g10693 [Coprinellus aureogranulatus]
MLSSTFLLVPLALASYVSAHGFVYQITANGQTFTGAQPSGQRSNRKSVIRQVTKQDPIYGANNPAVNCGNGGGFSASDVASVNAGDVLKFDWRAADLSQWRHDTGPIITYLADCGNTPCNNFDSKKAKWFKIDQQGYAGNSGDWVQKKLMSRKTVDVKIPDNVAPGNYLIRHEIIALHIADKFQGAEFYPSCAQLKIGGKGTGRPSANELVSFPGGYSDNDKGIFGGNFYGGKYTFPGPPIAKLAGGAGAAPPADDTPAPTSTSSSRPASGPTSTAAGSKPTQTKGGNSNGNTGSGNTGNTGNSGSGSSNNGGSASSGSSTSGPKKVCKAKSSKSKNVKPTVRPRHSRMAKRRLASVDGTAHGVSA